MIFPKNGKVVVFDDQYNEVKDLLRALSIHRIPFVYYQDEAGEDLPDEPLDGIRIIILDLKLFTSGIVSEKDVIGSIATRLEKVLQKDPSYLLLFWSQTEEKYRELLNKAFDSELSDFKPILQLSLNKAEAFSDPKKTFEYVRDKLENEIAQVDVLQAYFEWENIICTSTSGLVTELLNLVPRDEHWNDNLKSVLERLAYAYHGKRSDNQKHSVQKKLSRAFFTLNHIHIDNIEQTIRQQEGSFDADKLFDYEAKGDNVSSHKINTKLLIANETEDGLEPGSVFIIEKMLESDIDNEKKCFKRWQHWTRNHPELVSRFSSIMEGNKDRNISFLKELHDAHIEKYNEIFESIWAKKGGFSEHFKDSIMIELNISPVCDYAQDKMPYCRLLPGFMLKEAHRKHLKKTPAIYCSPVPIEYSDEKFYFVFDFKFLYSVSEKCITNRKPHLKIRQQLLADLQAKLGNHVNRPGVLYVP